MAILGKKYPALFVSEVRLSGELSLELGIEMCRVPALSQQEKRGCYMDTDKMRQDEAGPRLRICWKVNRVRLQIKSLQEEASGVSTRNRPLKVLLNRSLAESSI